MHVIDSTSLKNLSISVGSVFKMTFYPEDGIHPKHKGETSRDNFFVILGISEDGFFIGNVIINSAINENQFIKIGPYQHCIYKSNYDFLTKSESYIDCYRIREIERRRILEEAQYVGFLNDEDIEQIKMLASKSPVTKIHILRKYHIVNE